jgi:hypothetical protein
VILKLSLSTNDITQLAPLLCVNTNLSQYTTVSGIIGSDIIGSDVIGSDALTLVPATISTYDISFIDSNTYG